MQCKNCKTENQNGNFCSECGCKLKGLRQPTLAETILTWRDERECGMKYCPFHHWAKVTNEHGPCDSICELPGEGGNVLWAQGIKTSGKRLPKCFKIKPLSDEFLKEHPELTKDYDGDHENDLVDPIIKPSY